MITLHVTFRTGSTPIKLTSCAEEYGRRGCIIIVEDTCSLEDTGLREACVGVIKEGAGDIPPGQVVLKFATGSAESVQDLKAELSIYNNQLKELQGRCIPHCYGLFEGPSRSEGDRPFHCLVLEYAGKPVRQPKGFMSLDINSR